MSVSRDVYLIYGYDLTPYKDEIMTEDFVNSEEYDDLSCYQRKGKIQLFSDPMSGDHLYLGYIIGELDDDYSEQKISIDFSELDEVKDSIREVGLCLVCNMELPKLEVILFPEYS